MPPIPYRAPGQRLYNALDRSVCLVLRAVVTFARQDLLATRTFTELSPPVRDLSTYESLTAEVKKPKGWNGSGCHSSSAVIFRRKCSTAVPLTDI